MGANVRDCPLRFPRSLMFSVVVSSGCVLDIILEALCFSGGSRHPVLNGIHRIGWEDGIVLTFIDFYERD